MTQGDAELMQDSEFQPESQSPDNKQKHTRSRSQSFPMVELMEKSFESQRTNTGSHPTHIRVKVQLDQRIGRLLREMQEWGHPEANCSTGMICERCQGKGHLARIFTEYRVNNGKAFVCDDTGEAKKCK
ncbi:hypothetical protein PHMEG_00025941 [Phytophthora megakarya]|uniref:Uncharacterized protein n=1 Tax=Phytophthora megakarya TaxID=4795 RepID=A0A225V9T0_9STRA|nr:hypothetical protein PHMEG_00025941 [Phytophthora megakarya]